MKSNRIIIFVLCLLLMVSCKKTTATSMWELGSRYDSNYSKICHVYHFSKDGDSFYLSITRTKKKTESLKNMTDSITVDSDVYALCESDTSDESGNQIVVKSYECLDGSFHYLLRGSDPYSDISSILSLMDAASLMRDPLSVPSGIVSQGEEWTAYYRTRDCNLEIYVYPSDSGKSCSPTDDSYELREENGESYFYSESDKAILYTNGTDTVWIRQSDRSGSDHALYSTLAECKAILAMLGSN